MIAPLLGKELTIELTGKVGSWPYILMTLNIMKDFGAEYKVEGEQIKISNIPYSAIDKFWVESDWSAASYWYSIVSLSKSGSVFLPGLNKDSMQGDSAIAKIMQPLGVNTEFSEKGVSLQRIPDESSHLEWDFTDCPDLAQTVAVICAAKGVKCKMTGLESLRIKETDRINALQTELAKFNVDFKEVERSWIIDNQINPSLIPVEIDTYEDHRMAMAFAPISILCPIIINDPEVVEKSYPHFWDDIENSTSGSSS